MQENANNLKSEEEDLSGARNSLDIRTLSDPSTQGINRETIST